MGVRDVAKFKVGDRVRVGQKARMSAGDTISGVVRGCIGIIEGFGFRADYEEEADVVYVRFDREIRSGTDLNPDGTYQMWKWQLEHVDASCAAFHAYTAACEQFEAAELALEKAKAAVQDARLKLRDALDGET